MHQIMVSDEIMDRLRSLCLNGGQSKDYVLRSLLGCSSKATPDGNGDFIDATYGIRFAEGMRIFRTYKGRPYSAQVSNGRWVLEGVAGTFNSFNQLSQAFIDGNENAWMFWFYQSPGGEHRRIAELRDPDQVQRRPRRNRAKEHTRKSAAPPPQPHHQILPQEAAPAPLAPPPATGPLAAPGTTTIPTRTGGSKPWEPA
jgi:hypothetical protein